MLAPYPVDGDGVLRHLLPAEPQYRDSYRGTAKFQK
jgi:hypothetical protein